MEFFLKSRRSNPNPNTETSRENRGLDEYHIKQVTLFRTNRKTTNFFFLFPMFLEKSLSEHKGSSPILDAQFLMVVKETVIWRILST